MTPHRAQERAARRPARHLDPAAPLVVDLRDLGRRAGAMRAVQRTVPAPAGLGVELVHVPAGDPVALDLRLESVVEGVYVSGTVRAPLTGECGRCLAPLATEVTAELQELFAYDGATTAPDPLATGEADEEDLRRVEGDLLDLAPAVRDALVLAMPLQPLCRPDCAGLCPDCGEPLAELPADHAHDVVDPRWAALRGLVDDPGS